MLGAHHFCRALIHFPVAPLSIYLASFSASAASPHECSLSSTFSALISSSSHQSPSELTAATSDLSVHASLSYSLPLFPAHSPLCLSQSISLATTLTPAGVGAVVLSGGFTPLKHFARQPLVKEAADNIVECQEDEKYPHIWFIVHRGQKLPLPVTSFFIKQTHCLYFSWVSMWGNKFPKQTHIFIFLCMSYNVKSNWN